MVGPANGQDSTLYCSGQPYLLHYSNSLTCPADVGGITTYRPISDAAMDGCMPQFCKQLDLFAYLAATTKMLAKVNGNCTLTDIDPVFVGIVICDSAPDSKKSSSGLDLSWGAYFLIGFGAAIFVYFAGGIVYNKQVCVGGMIFSL